jgi:hypothetical protein
VWDMKTKALPILSLFGGMSLALLGVLALLYKQPASPVLAEAAVPSSKMTSLTTKLENAKSDNPSVSNGAISSLFIHRQSVRAAPPVPVIPPPIPEKAPADGRAVLKYLGYVSDADGTRKYYFKDIQKNIPISASENETKNDLAILQNNESSFTVRFGGTTYDIPKK